MNGVRYGGTFAPIGDKFIVANDERLVQFRTHFPGVRSILELGSLEGGHTVALARMPGVERVVGIEGRDYNVEKAMFIRSLYGTTTVEFAHGDLERFKLSSLGETFDVVFCCGLLYHLRDPWTLLSQLSTVSQNLFLDTHYANEDSVNAERRGYRGMAYNEFGIADPLSGLSATSFWPTFDSLTLMLNNCGFREVVEVSRNAQHPNGPRVSLVAKIGAAP